MDTIGATFVGSGPVGPIGPQQPTAGLFGSGGNFNSANFMNTTSALTTGIGAYSTIVGGDARQYEANFTAQSQDLQANVVRLNAIEAGNQLKRQLLADLGAATASAAARGIDVGSGTPRRIVQESIGTTMRDVSKAEAGANIQALSAQTSAARTRQAGANAKLNASLRATKSLVGYGLSRVL